MTDRDDPRDHAGSDTPRECAEFEATLPDYLDETLAVGAADAAARHVAECGRCQALVRDLEVVRTRAAALPVLRPSRDLWAGIEARIEATSPSAGSRGAGATSARQTALRRWFGPHYATRVSALAAGLVVATAAITYLATRALVAGAPAAQTTAVRSSSRTTGAELVSAAPTSEYLYNTEIAALHQILEQRRTQLDPKTVVVIEHNLAVIDTAIAQSKAALGKDPANAFLVDQLDRDLDTKLELLRTVAMLPSRT